MRQLALLGILMILNGACGAVNAQECRMSRESSHAKLFSLAFSPVKHFLHWKHQYCNPTACTMVLCHGSCGSGEHGCTMNNPNGCTAASGCSAK